MIRKRLLELAPDSKKYIAGTVVLQWLKLCSNIALMFVFSNVIRLVVTDSDTAFSKLYIYIAAAVMTLIIRYVCVYFSSKTSFYASAQVKKVLREKMYNKLSGMGRSYSQKVSTAEVVQVFVEGIDQLELYFGKYLPQFFFSMLAPVMLFIVLSFVNFKSALVLMICVPLIPLSIVAVQKIAKRLLNKYWGVYVTLGDTFLENIQGLTTLKIYGADERKNVEMNEKAEEFRRITMKVLTMQLNSVSVMDIVAYGGSAAGIIIAVYQVLNGNIDFSEAFLIISLAADFFLPLRLLGSFFHVAMNGMAASDKLFNLLDIPDDEKGDRENVDFNSGITFDNVSFSYNESKKAVDGVSFKLNKKGLTAVVGESGCGKSTLASVLCGTNTGYTGDIFIGSVQLRDIAENALNKNMTAVNFDSYIFSSTVRENLLMAKPDADDGEMLEVLKKVNLDTIDGENNVLDYEIKEAGGNLSGGQRQRLAVARALLHDASIYVFDEVTSNIDSESEEKIMDVIRNLAKEKTVLMISHRLENVKSADNIILLKNGRIAESGTHEELMNNRGGYYEMYSSQSSLENYTRKEAVVL